MDGRTELERLGFRQVGVIRPCDGGRSCRAEVEDLRGFLVYAQLVGNVIKKFGITKPSLKARVLQNVSTINGVIALKEGRSLRDAGWHHRPFDAYKRLAPAVIGSNSEIEIWALECASFDLMLEKESELNTAYKPEWTKEGTQRARRSRAADTAPASWLCECGCGVALRRCGFAPGHDQRLRIRIEARVGGLLALRDLIERLQDHANGFVTAEEISLTVRTAMRQTEDAG